jgi:glutamate mutase epsilon subunit
METKTEKQKTIERILSAFKSLKIVAFENQIKFMESIEKQYKEKQDLSDKQIETADKIVNQCKDFSRAWRYSRIIYMDE